MLAQAGKVGGKQDDHPGGQGRDDHQCHRRHDAAHAAIVEAQEGEAVALQRAHDQRCDEIARDDEEDIDADEPAARDAQFRVEGDDGEDGDGAQAIDVRAVAARDAERRLAQSPSPRSPRHGFSDRGGRRKAPLYGVLLMGPG